MILFLCFHFHYCAMVHLNWLLFILKFHSWVFVIKWSFILTHTAHKLSVDHDTKLSILNQFNIVFSLLSISLVWIPLTIRILCLFQCSDICPWAILMTVITVYDAFNKDMSNYYCSLSSSTTKRELDKALLTEYGFSAGFCNSLWYCQQQSYTIISNIYIRKKNTLYMINANIFKHHIFEKESDG